VLQQVSLLRQLRYASKAGIIITSIELERRVFDRVIRVIELINSTVNSTR